MELRDVIKKIMASAELKTKLKGLGSFDEVYGFFVANGYEGSAVELKKRLLGKSAILSAVTDDDLSNVAGGASGRQVLSACTGFMMLMGLSPFTNLQGHAITTPLHVAVKEGNLEDIKGSFEKNHDAINEEDENGLTPLHHAVKNNDLEKVKYLVENGADVNAPCLRDWYNAKNDEEWRKLWEAHPEQKNVNECGCTPLAYAVDQGHFDIVKYLVEHGADVNCQTLYNGSALHLAVSGENFNMDLVKYLVEHGVDINAEDMYGCTALSYALHIGTIEDRKIDIDLVKYLVEKGADVKSVTKASGAASWVRDIEVIDYLLDHGVDPNAGIWDAMCWKHNDIVKHLVERGADPSYALALVYNNDIDMAKWLVEHGADVNKKGNGGETPLHHAYTTEFADYLIKQGADINAKDDYGNTPLAEAIRQDRVDLAKYFVEHGANINDKDKNGYTSLTEAVGGKGNIDLTKYLVEHGADINVKDNSGINLLGHTFSLDVAKYLVEHGVDATNSLAPCFGRWMTAHQFDMIKYLVANGADVNATFEEDGSTQLHSVWNMELVKYLVEHGANVNAKDKQGKTPLDKALASDMVDKAKYLVNHGAHCSDSEWDFIVAVWFGDETIVDSAIENGADVNKCMIVAALLGREDLIDHLREKGADFDYGLFGAGIALNMDMVDKMLGKEGADVRFAIAGALVAGNVDFAKQLAEKDPEFELTDDNIKIFMDYITKYAEGKGLKGVDELSELSNELVHLVEQVKK